MARLVVVEKVVEATVPFPTKTRAQWTKPKPAYLLLCTCGHTIRVPKSGMTKKTVGTAGQLINCRQCNTERHTK